MVDLEKLHAKLDENIPAKAVAKRKAPGGVELSYLEAWYVIDRLNKVFGNTRWGYGTEELIEITKEEHTDRYGNAQYVVYYRAKVSLTYKVQNEVDSSSATTISDVGFGNGFSKKGYGEAHELAMKEAVSDGIKRCAKSLGMSLGLALYDKTQAHVEKSTNNQTKKSTAPKPQPSPKKAQSSSDKAKVLNLISTTSQILIKKDVMSLQELQALLKSKYSVSKKEELSLEQANAFYQTLKEMV